jgi:predicted dehydrogenase
VGERLRIGFVGAGAVARRHAASLAGIDGADVVAVADPDPAAASAFGAATGAAVFAGHEALLGAAAVDALYICVPPFAHGPPEHAAIDAGLPFFVEKPLAVDVPTAERIAARVAERGLVTAVGYHLRYLDTVEAAAELLAGQAVRLAQAFWLDTVPPPPWWMRRRFSGGQTIEQTTHVLDLLRVLVGEVAEVRAQAALGAPAPGRDADPDADVADVSTALLRFRGGALGTVSSTWLLRAKHRAAVELVADGLVLELSETELTAHDGGAPWRRAAGNDPKGAADRAFVDAALGRRADVRAPYAEALETHRLACAIDRSAAEDCPVSLPGGAPGG